jgi:NitT/TauT family transport system substrate-binding protein
MALPRFVVPGAVALALVLSSCSSGDDGGGEQAAGGGGGGDAPESTNLRLAVAAPGLPFLQLYVADEQGFYEDCGLTVEFLSVEGSAAATAALQSGSADATVSLPEGAITAAAAGAPLKIIGTTVDQNLYSMYGKEGVESLDDLAGQSIAILTEGNGTEIQARKLLDLEGAGADESTYVATGGLPNRLAAIQQGQVAGTLLFPPFDLNAEEAGLPKLYDLRDLGEDYPNEVIAVSETSIEENGEALQCFMDALAQGSSFIAENFDEAVSIGAAVTGSPEEQVRTSLESMQDAFSEDLSVSQESLQAVIDTMEEYGNVENLPSAEDLLDTQFTD